MTEASEDCAELWLPAPAATVVDAGAEAAGVELEAGAAGLDPAPVEDVGAAA